MRPHDIEVTRSRNGTAALEAVISYIHPIGPLMHIELTGCNSGNLIEVALSKDRYQELKFQEGERVFITPRKLRVFVQDGQSAARESLKCRSCMFALPSSLGIALITSARQK